MSDVRGADRLLRRFQKMASPQMKEAVRGALQLATQSGDITVDAVQGASASLDAGTGYGRISNTLRNDGTADLTIHATTQHGDITARSL